MQSLPMVPASCLEESGLRAQLARYRAVGEGATMMRTPEVGRRDRERRASRSPAQIASLVIGAWWTTNGIGAFFIDPNLATGRVHGSGGVFGLTITANGWHALFHLLPGLVGLAVASRPQAALAYALGAGAIYIVVGSGGLIAGGSSIGVIAVDTTGDVVHVIEGLIAFTAGVWTLVGGPRKHCPVVS
jgi:hypothetical protein